MANKTMHHVVIGDDTFELIDEAGREETTALKEELDPIIDDTKPWGLYTSKGTNVTQGASTITTNLPDTLYADNPYGYKIVLSSDTPFSKNAPIYFRNISGSANLNKIGDVSIGTSEAIFYAKPSANCNGIRWNIADEGARYTVTIYDRKSSIDTIKSDLVDTQTDVSNIENGLIHYNTIAKNSGDAVSANSAVTIPFDALLSQGTVYRVNIKTDAATTASVYVYYRDTTTSANYNYIGTINSGETEWTFDVAPTGNTNAIRINKGNADLTYTVTVSIPVEAITDIYARLENVRSDYEIPEYWETELEDSITKIQANQLLIGENGVEFFFVTDTHWDTNAKHSGELLAYLTEKCRIPSVVFGGDALKTYNTSKAGAINELRTFYNAYNKRFTLRSTVGNHDTNATNNPDSSTFLSNGELYAVMLRADETTTTESPSALSGYWDNPSQKIRFIQMQKYLPTLDSDVQDWVDARITELPAGWSVILFSHAVFESQQDEQPHIPFPSVQAIQHFAGLTANAEIICWIVGHCHYDAVDNSYGFPVVSTQTDNYMMSAQYGGAVMTLGTSTEQAFDCYQIDTLNKVIHIIRIGAGNDRVVQYSN